MSKATIRKLFVASLVAIAGGLVLLGGAGALAYANATVVKNGPDVVAVHATPFGWVMSANQTKMFNDVDDGIYQPSRRC